MPDGSLRAALDQLRGALRERLLDEEQGNFDPSASLGAEPRRQPVTSDPADDPGADLAGDQGPRE
jgi:hypothetical protein